MNPDVGPRCPECRLGLGRHDERDPQCDHHAPKETRTVEYTPTTDEIRRGYAETIDALGGMYLGYSQFDRWLAQHEAEIRADQIEKDAEIAEEAPSDWAMTYREFAADTIARAIARAIRAQPVSETTEGERP